MFPLQGQRQRHLPPPDGAARGALEENEEADDAVGVEGEDGGKDEEDEDGEDGGKGEDGNESDDDAEADDDTEADEEKKNEKSKAAYEDKGEEEEETQSRGHRNKESPNLSFASIRKGKPGMPYEGLHCLYIGSAPYRPTDLAKQMEAIDSGCRHGEHVTGPPYRNREHVLGILDRAGKLPPVVVEANLATEHTAEVCLTVLIHGELVL
ncbi:MAG: hypothetical protein SGPRY_000226 [Prymnesium sp.]